MAYLQMPEKKFLAQQLNLIFDGAPGIPPVWINTDDDSYEPSTRKGDVIHALDTSML